MTSTRSSKQEQQQLRQRLTEVEEAGGSLRMMNSSSGSPAPLNNSRVDDTDKHLHRECTTIAGKSPASTNLKTKQKKSARITTTGTDDPQLADQLSSSLASLATRKARLDDGRNKTADTREAGSEHTSDTSSSCGGNVAGAGTSSSVNVITASATTTNSSGSGEDRDSSAGNGSGSGSGGQESAAHTKTHTHDGERHHSNRQRRRSHPQPSPTSTASQAQGGTNSNDDYGLPVPIDDRLQRETESGPTAHATVVARLPPPMTDSGSSGSGAEAEQDREKSQSLLEPHREPAFHTIRRTFKKLPGRVTRVTNKSSETDSSGDQPKVRKKGVKRSTGTTSKTKDSKSRIPPLDSVNLESSSHGGDGDPGGSGSSSGSGTEGGYAGSASSNENAQKDGSAGSSSSEIPDFSSGASEGASESGAVGAEGFAFNTSPSNSPSLSSSSTGDGEGSSDDQEDREDSYNVRTENAKPLTPDRRKRRHEVSDEDQDRKMAAAHASWAPVPHRVSRGSKEQRPLQSRRHDTSRDVSGVSCTRRRRGTQLKEDNVQSATRRRSGLVAAEDRKPPILMAGCDVMAHVLTFLEPPDILDVLTMPLSKDWQNTFTRQQELWRVLCLLEPFKAKVDSDNSDSDNSLSSFSSNSVSTAKRQYGKYRLLYTSFVRCMRYLARIKDDAMHGRPPSVIDYGETSQHDIAMNRSLKNFLASARGIVGGLGSDSSENDDIRSDLAAKRRKDKAVGIADDRRSGFGASVECGGKRNNSTERKPKKRKLRGSMITQRMLGPGPGGEMNPANVELPWSCAIYSIVNWMVAFSDVEGIQIMCLKVLPFLLEDERQRITAQRAGLTDVVLRGMVMFPNSVQLHIVSFHTIVLLARPLGGREGMLFHSSMVNSSGIFSGRASSGMFSGAAQNGKNGIAVMLDSMRRFVKDEVLQAMSCWSLVNIALAPVQKEVLVKLGGIEVTVNAMMQHPHNAEVQFRALFALINLVIPSVSLSGAAGDQEQGPAEVNGSTEEEVLDEIVGQVVDLVVLAMKNFCSSEAILNRACLVLHNLSLTQAYHSTLLWTPNCYQMLEWCLTNYPTDQVLQQSAAGTLHRLQVTLSNDDNLAARFTSTIQAQNRESLEEAHREAITIYEQQQVLQQNAGQLQQPQPQSQLQNQLQPHPQFQSQLEPQPQRQPQLQHEPQHQPQLQPQGQPSQQPQPPQSCS